MGKRGPAPTPTAKLKARGSWRGETRHGEPEAKGDPVAPEWLSDNSLALWELIVPQLEGMGIAGLIDSMALARYVTLFERWLECEQFLRDNGSTYEDGGGITKEYPQASRASRLADQLLKLEQQYGMTASARVSLAVDNGKSKKEPDGIAGIINPKLVG